MRKGALAGLLLFTLMSAQANTPEGYHWYTAKPDPKPMRVVKPTLSAATPAPTPYKALRRLTDKTRNVLAESLLNPTPESTARYMRVQQFWAKQDQKFVQSWEIALRTHPELDYSLRVPTDNTAIKLRADAQKIQEEKKLRLIAKHSGLILFYKGDSGLAARFTSALLALTKQYGFSMMSVCVSGSPIMGLPNPKRIPLRVVTQHIPLKSRYLPALYFVNLTTKSLSPVSFGFLSSDNIKSRIVDVADHFKRYSYEGEAV